MEAWRWTVDKAENFHLGVSVPPQTLEHPIHAASRSLDFGSDVNNFTKKIFPKNNASRHSAKSLPKPKFPTA